MAPLVLESDVKDWFEFPVALKRCLTSIRDLATSKPRTENLISSICHIDELAKVQVVFKNQIAFHQLISSFKKITKIPILVNTSFNCDGNPIILDFPDLIATMFRVKIQYNFCNSRVWELNEEHFIQFNF